jgi:hypothetical protein
MLVAIFFLFFINIFSSASSAQTGIGIFPAKIEIKAPFLKNTFTDITIFNPSQRELNFKVEMYCRNCEREVKLFNKKIGNLTYFLDAEVFPNATTAEPMSQKTILVKFKNPLFLKGVFQTTIFGKEVKIPAYLLHFDKEDFNYRVIVATTSTPIEISLVSDIFLDFVGISKSLFMLGVLALLSIASFVYYFYIKRAYGEYEKI